jgi:hypothetical protein
MTEPEHACPRCAAPHEPGQEYCLECGMRLGGAEAEPGAAPPAEPPRRKDFRPATAWRPSPRLGRNSIGGSNRSKPNFMHGNAV